MIEALITNPDVTVPDAEFHRLLGYPRHHEPGERPRELAAETRRWFAEHGQPWVYLREAALEISDGALRIDGHGFESPRLHGHLLSAEARRIMLVAVSAGRACEQHAAELWQEAKPDEYFFTEVFGSAVVEHLVAGLSGRICDLAERDGWRAIAHYSPGYAGWDIADQARLFDLITRGATQPLPEPLEVLGSGMLRPKKSLLAVIGLTARPGPALNSPRLIPCENCSFAPCQYRRAPYRHAATAGNDPAPLRPPASVARYSIGTRALAKWARERVALRELPQGRVDATFRFDGTTCANLGQALAFDYVVSLASRDEAFRILRTECAPAPGDTGHTQMCAYLTGAAALMNAIAEPPPLVGRPLGDVLAWQREPRSTGCYCDAASRAHKWGLALEAIHYALTHREVAPPEPLSTLS